jgi:hypothetical protein
MFPTIGLLAWQTLGIVGSQIKIERIFSLASILTNLRRCSLQLENLEEKKFVNKNWPNDVKVVCKSFNDLVEFIEKNEQLEEKLQEFEGEFEQE